MANTIAVHHAGPGEAYGGYPRVKVWCDIVPNLKLKELFEDVAKGIEGIVDIHTSKCDHAHVELIFEREVNVDTTASTWIHEVNERLRTVEPKELKKYYQPNPDAMASHSTTSTYHGADRSD